VPARKGLLPESATRRNVEQGPPESGRGIGGTWSRGPASGDATEEPAVSASCPALCASPGCGCDPFAAGSFAGAGVRALRSRIVDAALRAPSRTTLRETESGAHPQRGGCRGGAGAPTSSWGCDPRSDAKGSPAALDRLRGQIPEKNFGARRGAEEGPQCFFGDLTPKTRMGSAFERRALDRLHGRIPQAGPCSTFRRSLFHSPAVPLPPCDAPSKHKPLGTCSALRGTFVARLANSASVGCTSLRAIDDSGAHRTRVSSCQGLLANPFRRLCTI
jgi:hypothetical protein